MRTLFDRPLALFLLARHAEAGAALPDAHAARPNVLLLPVADGPCLRIGGKEEAWRNRRDHRAPWEGSGARPRARGSPAADQRAAFAAWRRAGGCACPASDAP